MKNLTILVLTLLSAYPLRSQAPLDSLISEIDRRTQAYEDYEDVNMLVRSETRFMNGKWQPEKIVLTEKRAFQKDGKTWEEIIRVTEKEKGREKDLTEKASKEAAKAREKADRAEAEKDSSDKKEVSLGLGDLFPFSEEKRPSYSFSMLGDTLIENRSLLRIRAEAIQKNEKIFEGVFSIDPETKDVRMVDLQPSKNPKFVKNMRMQMSFDVMPGNRMVVTRTWMRVFASLLIKKIRIEAEEKYSDYVFE
ncbi:hypothetical protein JW906_12835 [bacterium]|nr:hypothetical protein [bacterium]